MLQRGAVAGGAVGPSGRCLSLRQNRNNFFFRFRIRNIRDRLHAPFTVQLDSRQQRSTSESICMMLVKYLAFQD